METWGTEFLAGTRSTLQYLRGLMDFRPELTLQAETLKASDFYPNLLLCSSLCLCPRSEVGGGVPDPLRARWLADAPAVGSSTRYAEVWQITFPANTIYPCPSQPLTTRGKVCCIRSALPQRFPFHIRSRLGEAGPRASGAEMNVGQYALRASA